jgi:aminoglycoside 2'-N-acetyltransferase I
MEIRVVRSEDLSSDGLAEIQALLVEAFGGDFSDHDWRHTIGGWHVIATDEAVVAHAALVERLLGVGGRLLRAGYVEGVATAPSRQRQGLGSSVMRRIGGLLEVELELGALSTGNHAFYERLGWERWQGPTFVRHDEGVVRTAEEDDGLMVLRFGSTADLSLALPISVEARAGDDW